MQKKEEKEFFVQNVENEEKSKKLLTSILGEFSIG